MNVITLQVSRDGKRDIKLPVCTDGKIDWKYVDKVLIDNPPPQARGSVAVLINEDLPRRHPKRQLIIASSVHGSQGPKWALHL
jgi:hypothetical protein